MSRDTWRYGAKNLGDAIETPPAAMGRVHVWHPGSFAWEGNELAGEFVQTAQRGALHVALRTLCEVEYDKRNGSVIERRGTFNWSEATCTACRKVGFAKVGLANQIVVISAALRQHALPVAGGAAAE